MNTFKPYKNYMQSVKFSTYASKENINSVFFYKCEQYKLKKGDILRVAQLNCNDGVYKYHYRIVSDNPFISSDKSLSKYDIGYSIKEIDKKTYTSLLMNVGK